MLVNAPPMLAAVVLLCTCWLPYATEVCSGSSCAEEAFASETNLLQSDFRFRGHTDDSPTDAGAMAAMMQDLVKDTRKLQDSFLGHMTEDASNEPSEPAASLIDESSGPSKSSKPSPFHQRSSANQVAHQLPQNLMDMVAGIESMSKFQENPQIKEELLKACRDPQMKTKIDDMMGALEHIGKYRDDAQVEVLLSTFRSRMPVRVKKHMAMPTNDPLLMSIVNHPKMQSVLAEDDISADKIADYRRDPELKSLVSRVAHHPAFKELAASLLDDSASKTHDKTDDHAMAPKQTPQELTNPWGVSPETPGKLKDMMAGVKHMAKLQDDPMVKQQLMNAFMDPKMAEKIDDMMNHMENIDKYRDDPQVQALFANLIAMMPVGLPGVVPQMSADPELLAIYNNPKMQAYLAEDDISPEKMAEYRRDPELRSLITRAANKMGLNVPQLDLDMATIQKQKHVFNRMKPTNTDTKGEPQNSKKSIDHEILLAIMRNPKLQEMISDPDPGNVMQNYQTDPELKAFIDKLNEKLVSMGVVEAGGLPFASSPQ